MPPNEQALFVCKDLSYSIGKKRFSNRFHFLFSEVKFLF
ncbi:hypothetical protein LEP1GSC116_1632 [Leptospira interrogans serovar Icterohaemorrhagiae str. Verdun HP]|uniref:Uncharacterized protein n=8 Tax=Leptospira interrogans TaxID=173 RepID=M6ZKD0_LEPIR|nr:hypothetical protein LEP1GSC151_5200 [Leptospira interrogans serovar Grippotyphosa str. LT2186]EMG19535.1 hypothetical protein LEP1GSC150_4173 [Leptospira interrogans serovar Copenhageni str. LT2050]EMM84259.1 hypothetical protein LEP1GSC037_5612 [Leptospira interrogans str. 2006001854]EMM96287.1 hypothetical protein LEP1GSC158_3130 [Leptospira interrogans serovar Zanoni str. LT2156]EMO05901.1 hypothetical protein LEP1GSC116_1632 [Leptospira interrogans serovar Icterohaemorrhagiae str. Verdu